MKSHHEIQSMVAAARLYGGVTVRMIICEPGLAEHLLTLNTNNRVISPSTVQRYVQEIHADEWYPSPAGIGIDDHGVLIDGQHRLQAIVDSDLAVPLLVVTGLPRVSQEKVDRHRKRTLHDIWKLAGITDSRRASQIANFLSRYDPDSEQHTSRPLQSDANVKIVYFKHRAAIDHIVGMVGTASSSTGISTAPVLAAIVLGYEECSPKAIEFWKMLRAPYGHHPDDAPVRLHMFLTGKNREYASRAGRQVELFKKTCYAMNCWFISKQIKGVMSHNYIRRIVV